MTFKKNFTYPPLGPYIIGGYLGTLNLFSNKYTGVGLAVTKDGGRKFWVCKATGNKKGGSSPELKVKGW